MPETWKSNLNLCKEVPTVDAFASSAVHRVWQELSLPDATKLDCRLHLSTDERTHTNTLACWLLFLRARYTGARGAALTWRSELTFNWAIAVDGVIHESEVCVRADHASERGVPFPKTWKSDLGLGDPKPVVDVDALAHSAALRVREELSSNATEIDCRQPHAQPHAHTPRCIHSVLTPTRAFARLYLCVAGTPDPAVSL